MYKRQVYSLSKYEESTLTKNNSTVTDTNKTKFPDSSVCLFSGHASQSVVFCVLIVNHSISDIESQVTYSMVLELFFSFVNFDVYSIGNKNHDSGNDGRILIQVTFKCVI